MQVTEIHDYCKVGFKLSLLLIKEKPLQKNFYFVCSTASLVLLASSIMINVIIVIYLIVC